MAPVCSRLVLKSSSSGIKSLVRPDELSLSCTTHSCPIVALIVQSFAATRLIPCLAQGALILQRLTRLDVPKPPTPSGPYLPYLPFPSILPLPLSLPSLDSSPPFTRRQADNKKTLSLTKRATINRSNDHHQQQQTLRRSPSARVTAPCRSNSAPSSLSRPAL